MYIENITILLYIADAMNIKHFIHNHPSLRYASDMQAICNPLQRLGIAYFSHASIDGDNKMAALATLPSFFELYFNKGHYHADLHAASFKAGESSVLWDFVKRKPESQAVHQDFMSFNIGHTFSLVFNHGQQKDCYHFAAKLGNMAINGDYSRMLEPLKQFINFFKEKIAQHPNLRSAYTRRLSLKPTPDGYFAENLEADIATFLDNIQSSRAYSVITNKYLTARELECLYWLGQGKTLEETACILKITPRTIKAHVKSIKYKLGCESQFQLGMQYAVLAVKNQGKK